MQGSAVKRNQGSLLGHIFSSSQIKGRVSDADFTLRLHFGELLLSAPSAGDSASVLDFHQREETSSSHEKLEHHIWKTLGFISDISCNSAWFYFEM